MKRIVICCDGTWNTPKEMDDGELAPTNVCRLKEAVERAVSDVTQIVFYHPGVGTSGSFLRRLWDGYTGTGVAENIRHAYRFVIEHFEPGDQLFLFGFSRGAFTARSLAGLIRNCGILRREEIRRVGAAFRFYRSRDPAKRPRTDEAARFRRKYAVEDITPIEFIGVWDTVGALGNPLFFKFVSPSNRFHDLNLSTAVRNAFQAVAIDEKRTMFRPALWQRQLEPPPAEIQQRMGVNPDGSSRQRLEQVWFCGTHSNVGGGYHEHNLSDIALAWMVARAAECGLRIDYVHTLDNWRGVLRESWLGLYRLLRPYYRLIDEPSIGTTTCESLHGTVPNRFKNDDGSLPPYRPPNLESFYRRNP